MDWFGRRKRAVATLDLSGVKKKVMERHRWGEKKAREAEAEYRRFLYLLAKHSGPIVPWTRDLDVFWHEHILDTRRYAVDCQKVCGRFIHHDPHIKNSPEQEAGARHATRAAFRAVFIGRERPDDPALAWMIPTAATLAALGISPATAGASQKPRKSDSCGGTVVATGCGGTPAHAAATQSTFDGAGGSSGGAGNTGASCSGGGSSCGGGGGGCGGGG